MAATPTLFSLLVHHGPTTSIIHDIDQNWYSYLDMCQDVLETVLVDLPANIGADINIKGEIPNSMDIMNVNNDTDMLNMTHMKMKGVVKFTFMFHLHLMSLNTLLLNSLKKKL